MVVLLEQGCFIVLEVDLQKGFVVVCFVYG